MLRKPPVKCESVRCQSLGKKTTAHSKFEEDTERGLRKDKYMQLIPVGIVTNWSIEMPAGECNDYRHSELDEAYGNFQSEPK